MHPDNQDAVFRGIPYNHRHDLQLVLVEITVSALISHMLVSPGLLPLLCHIRWSVDECKSVFSALPPTVYQ